MNLGSNKPADQVNRSNDNKVREEGSEYARTLTRKKLGQGEETWETSLNKAPEKALGG